MREDRIMKCDGDTFAKMYQSVYQDLYRFALCILRDGQEAEDAVSEAVLAGYENIGKLRKEEAFKSWMFTILANQCKKRFRERARLVSLDQEKTFFVDAAFSTMLVVTPIILSFVLLPVIFEAFTRGKKNPYKILYRNTASQLTALTSGSYIASMPYIMAGERINDGVQKRIASTTSPLYYIIGHGGSAAGRG